MKFKSFKIVIICLMINYKWNVLQENFCIKIFFCYYYFSPLKTFIRKGKNLGGPKTFGSGTPVPTHWRCMTDKDGLNAESVMLFSEKRKWRTWMDTARQTVTRGPTATSCMLSSNHLLIVVPIVVPPCISLILRFP